MKICNKCNEDKPLIAFGIRSKEKDGLNPTCKECIRKQDKKYYFSSRKELMALRNQKPEVKKYNKQWIEQNKDRFKENRKKWNDNNKEKIKEYSLVYSKKRYKNNINHKISLNLRNRLNDALKNNYKTSSAITLLACSLEEFKLHLEKQFLPEMNWENHGKIWEMDHIKPCALFDLSKIEEQKQCFHYMNYQPLFKTTKIAESFNYFNQIGNRDKADIYV
jgi:hypothetical protein